MDILPSIANRVLLDYTIIATIIAGPNAKLKPDKAMLSSMKARPNR